MRIPHLLLTLSALALLAVPAFAEEEAPAEMADFDMEAMWAAYMEDATPGDAHAQLMELAGSYNIAGKFRHDPAGEWSEMPSTETIESMLGGRFLHMHAMSDPSDMMPEGFEGAGVLGYNNTDERYEQTWMDTMGTMMLYMTGTADDEGVITLEGSYTCPYMGIPLASKWVYRFTDDGYIMEMWMPGMDGELFLGAELTATRA